jgi:Putative MetA-pathway of phenol degradation
MTFATLMVTMLAALMIIPASSDARSWPDQSAGQSSPGQPPQPPKPPQPPPPPPPPPEDRPERRGSMIGYIDDAIIQSQVRVRFEVGLENRAPDRAEFFYAKCGCYRDLDKFPTVPGVIDFFDPDAPGPGPDLLTELDFRHLMIEAEYAFNPRLSVFGELPLRWIQPQSFAARPNGDPPVGFGNQGGIGDLRAGVKFGLAGSPVYALTARVQAYLPTGAASDGMGTDHASFEPSIVYFHQPAPRFAIESQFGFWLPAGGSDGPRPSVDDGYAGNILFYGVGPSYVVYDGPKVKVAPVVELVGWRVLSGFEVPPGTDSSGTNIVNLKIGGRATFDRGSIYVGYGHALTDASWYDDIVRIEYRYTF